MGKTEETVVNGSNSANRVCRSRARSANVHALNDRPLTVHDRLKTCEQDIVKDMSIDLVAYQLKVKGVLDEVSCRAITSTSDLRVKARTFVNNVLLSYNPNSLNILISHLKEGIPSDYKHKHQRLASRLEDDMHTQLSLEIKNLKEKLSKQNAASEETIKKLQEEITILEKQRMEVLAAKLEIDADFLEKEEIKELAAKQVVAAGRQMSITE